MARIFITGSADGLGYLSAKQLLQQGHDVVVHARNEQRGSEAKRRLQKAKHIVTGDLSSLDETIALAKAVNKLGAFDAVIHNAGVYQVSAEQIFSVNVLAPYVLTCLIERPKRLVYLSSGMHLTGHAHLESFSSPSQKIGYSDSKLFMVMLTKAISRKWDDVYANAVDPGWVPTRMGGAGAPDDLTKGYETQTWLAVGKDDATLVSGKYFHHKKESRYNPLADDIALQERLLEACAEVTEVALPV